MANREELERAIKVLEKKRLEFLEEYVDFGGVNDAYLLAISTMRAELSRQENAPLTCEGCEREYAFVRTICKDCERFYKDLTDLYEPK